MDFLKKLKSLLSSRKRDEARWVQEEFLRSACDAMTSEIYWDSIDSGRLHWTTCAAKAESGVTVIVGVLDDMTRFQDLIDDAEDERRQGDLDPGVKLWLYLPAAAVLPQPLSESIVVKRV